MTSSLPRHVRTALLATGVATTLTLVPALALAHVGTDAGAHHEGLGAFAAGFAHPFTGLDHLMAMVGIGLWSATRGRSAWAAPLAFTAALLIGALLARSGIALPAVEPMIAASLLVIGLLAATKARLSTAAGVAVAAGFALFHGAAHGQEFGAAGGSAMLAGMVLASLSLHVVGLLAGRALQTRAVWLPRLAGGAVAAVGAALLAGVPVLG